MPDIKQGIQPEVTVGEKPFEPAPASSWPVYLMLLVSVALWGGTWPVGRTIANALTPCNAAFLRFVMASAMLVGVCLLSESRQSLRVPRRQLFHLFILGATGVFGYSFLFFSGLRTTPAGRAGLIVGCIPVCIAAGGAVMDRHRPSFGSLAGVFLSLSGVYFVISTGDSQDRLLGNIGRGDLMILGCVACWTCYSLLAKSVMRQLSPLVTVTWSCLFGTLLLLPFSLMGGNLWTEMTTIQGRDWAGLIYLGIFATGIGYYWYYRAIHRVGPIASGIFINLVPLFALLFGAFFLNERIFPFQLIGGMMIIFGVFITVFFRRSIPNK